MANQLIENGTSQLLLRYYEKNDEEALTAFFLQYKDLAFRIAYSILGNQADADDIMQQTFVQIIKKQTICKAAYDLDDNKVKSWLLSIVYNFARMHLRSKKIKATYSLEEERQDMPTSKENQNSYDAEKHENSQKLKKAVFNLPEKYRIPILMRYHEDMSIEDISKTLDTNPSTIRSILSRGINLLREKLSTDKVTLSSAGAIELIAFISYPTSQKVINLNFVKSCALAKTTSTKLAVTAYTKSTVLLKSLITIVAISCVTAIFLVSQKQKDMTKEPQPAVISPIPQIIEKKTKPKTTWDFSKEDGSDFKTTNNSITYDPKLKAITNLRNDSNNGKVNEQSIIHLGVKLENYTRIHSKGKMLSAEFLPDKETKNAQLSNYALDFVALKNSKPLSGYLIYRSPKPIDLPNYKEIPYEQDLYIIDNLITHTAKGHGFINIMRFDNLDNETELGLLLSGMYVETISIEPMSPALIEEIRNKTKAVLDNQKK